MYTCFDPKTRKIKVRIYKPNGTLSKGNTSPSDCSYEQDIEFNKGADLKFLVQSWGNKEKGYWPAGKYKIELWNDGQCLYVKNFEIYK